MSSNEIRLKFLEFFKKRGHSIITSSSLIPDDPSVLLTTAGMQQFKKYYTGEFDAMKDFKSRRTVSVQKCFRTSDLEEVGDESHLTFFEMLGNFSFGPVGSNEPADFGTDGYFKKSAIYWVYEFITKEMELEIDFVSVFEGDKEIPADLESEEIWKSIGGLKIKKFGRKDNFWGPTGNEGPCGPTTEIYVSGVEVWNIVFNEYYKYLDGRFEKLKNPGVDTGMGLERLAAAVQKKKNIFETDLFSSIIVFLNNFDLRVQRIISDHIRGIVFLINDGVLPSNIERGYVLRNLLRRIITHFKILKIDINIIKAILDVICKKYEDFYYFSKNNEEVWGVIKKEFNDFEKIFEKGWKIVQKIKSEGKEIIPPMVVFDLHQSTGARFELISEFAKEAGLKLPDENEFQEYYKKHQEISRTGMEKKFGGHGLFMDTGELKATNQEELKKATKLHTATHLLHQALRKVLGDKVKQMGSDITAERLRFDFSYPSKLSKEEIEKVEKLVNDKIAEGLEIKFKEMPFEEAVASGALAFFRQKYPQIVKVYSVGSFSMEVCGGPHMQNTKEVGKFKILKEEASSAGVRRIRATVLD